MRKVERGEDPIGTIRDPSRNTCLRLYAEPEEGATARRRGVAPGAIPGSRADAYDPVLREIRTAIAERETEVATP